MAITVAIIEDNLEFLGQFTEIVKSQADFLFVGSATTGANAFKLIDRVRADVYMIDLGLPDMFGTEVIKHALKRHGNCDVMVITVFGDEAHIIASIEAGATGYILKDSSPIQIINSIRDLYDGGSPVSPVIARKLLQKLQFDKAKSAPPSLGSAAPLPAAAAPNLTGREIQILHALSKGLSFKEIGESHQITPHTVASHVKSIYNKLAVNSRGQAVHESINLGLLEP